MAFAGLKKQINKANQYVTEKMGGAEGTKLDIDFMEMERKTDVTCELVEELQIKTKEFLQPNPTARAKMAAVKGISKLSGQAKSNTYPQPEGVLGECMLTYGRKLGEDSVFAQSLIEMGESMKQMADVKYALDDNIKQNFLEPLHHLQTKDLKEVMHHRKKLQGRRLDFDCKRRRQAKGSHITDEEIRQAEEKFAESLQLAQVGMFNLLDSDVEQVAQLAFFAEGLLDYHQQCTEVLKVLVENLHEKKEEAANRPKMEFVPKTLADLNIETEHGVNNGRAISRTRFGSTHNLSVSQSIRQNTNLKHSSSIGNLNRDSQRPYSLPKSNSSISDPKLDPLKSWENAWSMPSPPSYNHVQYRNGSLTTTQRPNQQIRRVNNMDPWTASPLPSPMKSPARTPMAMANNKPCCTALYDFEPENPGELGFKENDIITLISKVDENWYEGSVNGRTGYFPQSYVQVNVPIP